MSLVHYLHKVYEDGELDGCLSFVIAAHGEPVSSGTSGTCFLHGAPRRSSGGTPVEEKVFKLQWHNTKREFQDYWACMSCVNYAIDVYPMAFRNRHEYTEYIDSLVAAKVRRSRGGDLITSRYRS